MQDKSDWIFPFKKRSSLFHFRQNRQILEGGEAAVVPKTKPNDCNVLYPGATSGGDIRGTATPRFCALRRMHLPDGQMPLRLLYRLFPDQSRGKRKFGRGRRAVSPKFGRLQYFSAPTIESERRIWYNGGDLPDKKGPSRVCPRA